MNEDGMKSERLLAESGLSRRDFMWRTTAAGLTVSGATALAGRAEAAAEPRRGGHLRMGSSSGSTTDTLDPVTYIDWNSFCLAMAVGNTLTEIDGEKRVIPELATEWESSDGAKKWVFKLREGVEFHNGKPFTAADVVYTLNRHRGEDTKSASKPYLEKVTDLRADGDHTVVFELSEGNADLPAALSTYQFIIIPEGHVDWSTLVGTGGYRLKAYEPGVRYLCERAPNYWKEDRAWLDSFESITLGDPGARSNALITGEVDMIERADAKIIDRIKQRLPDYQVVENTGASYLSSAMDSRHAPFDDNNVRLALKYAIDREEFVAKILRGYGVVGNDHPVPPSSAYFNADLPQKTYDPDRARHHLKKAGLESLNVALSASDAAFSGAVDAAVLLKESAARANIEISVVREPNDGYWSSVWMTKPFSMVTWGTRATPSMQFDIAYACGAPWADGYLCHERFEALLKEVKVTTDFDKRKEIFGEMQQIQSDEGANHVFAFDASVNIFSDKVGGAAPDPMAPNMGMRVAERVWMTG